ncbi:hypothetical protein JCM14076_13430 [Methylosoma difficile]
MDNFADRLSHVLFLIKVRTKKTKQKIAEEINISASALTQLTNGKSKQASETTLNALKQKYSISPEWLIEGKGDVFVAEDGFENLRPEIIAATDKHGSRYVLATTLGWGKVLSYYHTEFRSNKSLNFELVKTINAWPDTANQVMPLYGNPVFFRNYASVKDEEERYSLIDTAIIFHLKGTRPAGYIIAQKTSYPPIDERIYDRTNRVFLSCIWLFNVNWHSIKLANDYEYLIDLSHKEYLDILNTQPPKDILKLAR